MISLVLCHVDELLKSIEPSVSDIIDFFNGLKLLAVIAGYFFISLILLKFSVSFD